MSSNSPFSRKDGWVRERDPNGLGTWIYPSNFFGHMFTSESDQMHGRTSMRRTVSESDLTQIRRQSQRRGSLSHDTTYTRMRQSFPSPQPLRSRGRDRGFVYDYSSAPPPSSQTTRGSDGWTTETGEGGIWIYPKGFFGASSQREVRTFRTDEGMEAFFRPWNQSPPRRQKTQRVDDISNRWNTEKGREGVFYFPKTIFGQPFPTAEQQRAQRSDVLSEERVQQESRDRASTYPDSFSRRLSQINVRRRSLPSDMRRSVSVSDLSGIQRESKKKGSIRRSLSAEDLGYQSFFGSDLDTSVFEDQITTDIRPTQGRRRELRRTQLSQHMPSLSLRRGRGRGFVFDDSSAAPPQEMPPFRTDEGMEDFFRPWHRSGHPLPSTPRDSYERDGDWLYPKRFFGHSFPTDSSQTRSQKVSGSQTDERRHRASTYAESFGRTSSTSPVSRMRRSVSDSDLKRIQSKSQMRSSVTQRTGDISRIGRTSIKRSLSAEDLGYDSFMPTDASVFKDQIETDIRPTQGRGRTSQTIPPLSLRKRTPAPPFPPTSQPYWRRDGNWIYPKSFFGHPFPTESSQTRRQMDSGSLSMRKTKPRGRGRGFVYDYSSSPSPPPQTTSGRSDGWTTERGEGGIWIYPKGFFGASSQREVRTFRTDEGMEAFFRLWNQWPPRRQKTASFETTQRVDDISNQLSQHIPPLSLRKRTTRGRGRGFVFDDSSTPPSQEMPSLSQTQRFSNRWNTEKGREGVFYYPKTIFGQPFPTADQQRAQRSVRQTTPTSHRSPLSQMRRSLSDSDLRHIRVESQTRRPVSQRTGDISRMGRTSIRSSLLTDDLGYQMTPEIRSMRGRGQSLRRTQLSQPKPKPIPKPRLSLVGTTVNASIHSEQTDDWTYHRSPDGLFQQKRETKPTATDRQTKTKTKTVIQRQWHEERGSIDSFYYPATLFGQPFPSVSQQTYPK